VSFPKIVQVRFVGGEIAEVAASEHAQCPHGLAERPGWWGSGLGCAAFESGRGTNKKADLTAGLESSLNAPNDAKPYPCREKPQMNIDEHRF
jgi:hypothetical protein